MLCPLYLVHHMKIGIPKWLYWGSEFVIKDSEKRKIFTINAAVFLGWLTMTFYGLVYLLSGNPALVKAALWYIPFYVIFGCALWLNKSGRSYWASILYSLTLTIAVAVEVFFVHGSKTGIHYYFIMFALAPTILFTLRQWPAIILIFALNVSLFLIIDRVGIASQSEINGLSPVFILTLRGTYQFTCALTLFLLVVLTEYAASSSEDQLERLGRTDGLTGIANRREFDTVIANEWQRAKRNHQAISLAIIDVDWFKKYNDLYGHQTGDDCLRKIARVLCENLRRSSDVVARYGGEEFVFIAPDTEQEQAMILAEMICQNLRNQQLPHEKSEFGHVTVSIGVATTIPEKNGNIEDLIRRADAALYEAKRKGRNRAEAG